MSLPKCDSITKNYFEKLIADTENIYGIAKMAKSKGFDVDDDVEVKTAINLADRTEVIIGPPGISKRYSELLAELHDRTKVIFTIFEEIVMGKLGTILDDEKRIEQAIKSALVLMTEGVVVAPLDGMPHINIQKNADGSKYVSIYYAGPIRAAGATAAAIPLLLAHKAQVLLNLGQYQPTDKELDRYVEEVKMYEKISPRQFKATEEDVRYIIKNCPCCMTGTGTDDDVQVNRDLPRVETNRIRGGMCLVMTDSLCLKAPKIVKYAKSLGLDWGWMSRFISVKKDSDGKKPEIKPVKKYLEGAAAGRPVFAYPSRFGGFRLRLGRCRTTGLMAKAIHPMAMYLLEEFPAVGTQFKVERPGKATCVSACDLIEPPIILTVDNEVIKIDNMQKYEKYKAYVKKILFLGDMLVCLGDFRKSGHPLIPVGFCEEWWIKLLEKQINIMLGEENVDDIKKADVKNDLIKYKQHNKMYNITNYEAIELARKYNVPLHPKYLPYYKQITLDELRLFRNVLKIAEQIYDGDKLIAIKFNNDLVISNILIKLVLPYKIIDNKIVLQEIAYPLIETLLPNNEFEFDNTKDILQNLTNLSGIEIKDKAGNFIGARMGRPEAAKPRKMKGSPHSLFPISKLGGATRSINKAVDTKQQESKGLLGNTALSQIEIGLYKCNVCNLETPYNYCFKCNAVAIKQVYCRQCGKSYDFDKKLQRCLACGSESFVNAKKGSYNIGELFESALKRLDMPVAPDIVKGVEGLISDNKVAEPIEKGIIRAKHNVFVFKDGTIRADLLDATITHFKPYELNLSVEKTISLGYTHDIYGQLLEKDDQILRIFPQDIIINTEVGDYFVNVANFIDELLTKFYGLPAFYNIKNRNDLIGHLFLGLAPHTSAAVVSRLLGFTKSRMIFAHPYHVCARRRNVDGDQDSIILLLDGLINFSKKYLSLHNGGRMDAPLVATLVIDPNEIDDEVHEMDINSEYELEVYEKANDIADTYFDSMHAVSKTLNTDNQYDQIMFTHDTRQFDEGPPQSMYTQIKDMSKKILLQIELQNKINAVDKEGALELVLNTHLFPDLIGNARSFARQSFRCTKCNNSFRRYPLNGKCYKCGNNNLILTIAEGSVKKYLEIAKKIVSENKVSEYTRQRLKILENEINTIFNAEKENQKNITDFF